VLAPILSSFLNYVLVTRHAEDTLRSPSITQVFNLLVAVFAAEATRTEGLIPRKDGKVFDLVAAGAATVRAVVANQRAVA